VLFSDKAFILGFLPVTFIVFYAVRWIKGSEWSTYALIIASMFFYAWWSVPFLCLLIGQLLVNYVIARRLQSKQSVALLAIAISLNLVLLGYFKYRNFFIENIHSLVFHSDLTLPALIVPLGISFHTFQQIAFLIGANAPDAYVPKLKNYALFVLFFPQLVAGPIVLNHEFDPQVNDPKANQKINVEMISSGLVIFLFGLFKKICLADNMAPYVDTAFNTGLYLQPVEAWVAVLSFVLQLYFDFSGYSDMAIGLGMMFGIRLPNNFLDPLRSTSIIELWTRWHITMTRFFMGYIYNPLSLRMMRRSRRAKLTRSTEFIIAAVVPTLITFLIAGFWHGANWTFGWYGITQGIALSINQAWRRFVKIQLPLWVGSLLTLGAFSLGQAFFRANTTYQGWQVFSAMVAFWRIRPPDFLMIHTHILDRFPTVTYQFLTGFSFITDVLFWDLLLGALVFLLPNISAQEEPLVPSPRLAFGLVTIVCLIVTYIGAPRTFIYFQF
jgi:alginate O-acetyltransferase complex protein AlgI